MDDVSIKPSPLTPPQMQALSASSTYPENGNNPNNATTFSNHYSQPPTKNLFHMPAQQQANETKVCVIVDSQTPVIIKIPLPHTAVTLADFKRALPALDNPKFKYFFKSNDSEFGIVKEEVQSNDAHLPMFRDRIVAWIVTPGGLLQDSSNAQLSSNNPSRNHSRNYSSHSNNNIPESNYTSCSQTSYGDTFDETTTFTSYFTNDGCSTSSETTCDTFATRRRPERSTTSSSSSSSSASSTSTLSSASTSATSAETGEELNESAVHFVTVHLILNDDNFLGLQISASTNPDGIDEGITIDAISEGSEVARDGRIEPGDKLVQVNDESLEELTNDEAVNILKAAVVKRGPLKLVVAKYIEIERDNRYKDAVQPIDTAAWVAHTQALTINPENLNSASSIESFVNHDPADYIRPETTPTHHLLHKNKTNVKDLIEHMRKTETGLIIKDKEWLGVSIPNAFLGSDLVTWLQRNVYGFNGRRDSKKYARRMLKEGHMKDPLSKKSFNTKSYYIFVT